MNISKRLESLLTKPLSGCNDTDIYSAILKIIEEEKKKLKYSEGKKKLYYVSAEFLLGKLLSSELISLGIYDEINALLKTIGKSIEQIENIEPEPSLGNGGLGRLAACFLDSIASLNLNGDGIGLCYHFGLFKQKFVHNQQTEEINPWINTCGFLKKTDVSFETVFNGLKIHSVMYDIDIPGNKIMNKLHLFDSPETDESIITKGISYDKKIIKKNLTLFLYPDDSDEGGKYLRLFQQYFMVSNAAQLIIKECIEKGCNLYDMPDYAVIQINDTHPALIIPELVRILTEKGIYIDDAIDIITRTCAYTNHTILAEALEKWPMEFFKNTIPQIVPIIEVLDNKIRRKNSDSSVYIIDSSENIHMAHIAIHYSFSTNGVARLHTEILKNNELESFYKIYPERFNNKTNGITFRRWLTQSNPKLDKYIESLIGNDFRQNPMALKSLENYVNDKEVLRNIKHENKIKLKKFIEESQGISLNENSVFDVQIKRLHEYKRQQMNILYYINKYLEIKNGILPSRPISVIFGAKASPAYVIAKDIIHLILCMQKLISEDKAVSPYLSVIMAENYNVTYAQHIIPACDISEQISLASKEASGTGNMKLMLNGAVTLGTEDGANVEIHELVGDENIYIFGMKSNEVIDKYNSNSYNPMSYYNKIPRIKQAVDFITNEKLIKIGNREILERLRNELLSKDWFMTLPDFESYTETKERAFSDYENRNSWAKKMLINIANAGYFSSDRTVNDYNKDIWKL